MSTNAINGYTTLAVWKNWKASAGQTLASETTDDGVINEIIEGVSRYIDDETARTFYPRVQSRVFDAPRGTKNDRVLWLDDDLLEIISVTNGDDVAVSSSDYNEFPFNDYPKSWLKFKQAVSTIWEVDSNGNSEGVIAVNAFWGMHRDYAIRAWSIGGTINDASFTATKTTLAVQTSEGSGFADDTLIKIENEIMRITGVSTDDLTVVRGENGSTAAAHDDDTTIYIWNVQHDIRTAAIQTATNFYQRRYGENVSGVATITAAGVVISPRDVPDTAQTIIDFNVRTV
jgi:hypothetical protein